jgi:hypothetical protein
VPRPEDLHELLSFEDPAEDRTWVFDVTFLTSNYACIFGRGCKGVLEEDATDLQQGCCSHGAHMIDEDDRLKLVANVARLRDDQWQNATAERRARPTARNDDGVHVTRVVDGGCMFLNKPGFAAGSGCALHGAALSAGERPLDWKPEVCWQLPIRRMDEVDPYGHVTTTVREWKRRDWGDGGQDFHWWCTETDEAFNEKDPVWMTMADELREITGDQVYDQLAKVLAKRLKKGKPVFLPHPAVRRK